MGKEKNCGNCLWHDVFSWACCNGDSEYGGEYMDPGKSCRCWEKSLNYDGETDRELDR